MNDVRDEIGAWVRAQIQKARTAAPHLISDGGTALQVWGTIGSVGYLTVTGDAVLEEDVGPNPGSFERFTGPAAFRTVLLFGARHHPDLLRWLPTRLPGDTTCARCSGSGALPVGPHPTCDICQGYGWLADTTRG